MAQVNILQNNFTAGEFSPLLYFRSDLTKYQNGAKEILNFLPLPYGGLTRRTGTKFVAPAKDSSKTIRLLPFVFSADTEQSYIVEFSDETIRFFKDGEQIQEAGQTITGLTRANPAVVTITSHGYSNGDQVFIDSVGGMTEVNGQWYTVAGATTNTFQLSGVDSTSYTAYTSGGSAERVYEVVSPYDHLELAELRIRQSADVLFIVHPDHLERQLTRTGDTSWTLTTSSFQDGPYLDENIESTTLTLSSTSGSVTVTASATTGINGGDGFQTTDVGRRIRWHDGTDWHWLIITARSSTTSVTASVQNGPTGGTSATTKWRLGAWSATTGYPRVTTFFENRAYYANTYSQPETVWYSAIDGYNDFTPGTNADDAGNFTLGSKTVNAIQWLNPRGTLEIGTKGSEWTATGGSDSAIGPNTPPILKEQDYKGSASLDAVGVDSGTLFVQRTGRKLRALAYEFANDASRSADVSLYSEHITGDGITALAYASEPHQVVWCIRSDGTLLSLTYNRTQEITAWASHTLGGTSPVVSSVAAIPNDLQDRTWVVVSRTIDGSTVKYIEYLEDEFKDKTKEEAHFVDSYYVYSGSATDTITGLHHLEGESVTILADGATHPNATVTDGAITLNKDYSDVTVGLGYTSRVTTLDFEGGAVAGSARGSRSRVSNLIIQLHESVGIEVGVTTASLQTISFRTPSDLMDDGVPLYSGQKRVRIIDSFRDASYLVFQKSDALPLTLLGYVAKVEVSDAR